MTNDRKNQSEGTGRETNASAHHVGQPSGAEGAESATEVDRDDPHKAEKLTKAGRDIDPNADSE